jgi:hypothetical protein
MGVDNGGVEISHHAYSPKLVPGVPPVRPWQRSWQRQPRKNTDEEPRVACFATDSPEILLIILRPYFFIL